MRSSTTILWSLCLAACCPGLTAVSQADELDRVARRLSGSASYSFTLTSKNVTVPARENLALKGKWKKAAPLYLKGSGQEIYRQGMALAYKAGGSWRRFDPGKPVTAPEHARRNILIKLRKIRAPHAEFAALRQRLTRISKTPPAKKGAPTVFAGRLDAAGALALLGGGAPVVARAAHRSKHAGRAKLWVSPAGMLLKYEITITWQEALLSHMGRSVNRITWIRRVTIRAVGATKLVVPPQARKALGK